jgi:hypothetical protein
VSAKRRFSLSKPYCAVLCCAVLPRVLYLPLTFHFQYSISLDTRHTALTLACPKPIPHTVGGTVLTASVEIALARGLELRHQFVNRRGTVLLLPLQVSQRYMEVPSLSLKCLSSRAVIECSLCFGSTLIADGLMVDASLVALNRAV